MQIPRPTTLLLAAIGAALSPPTTALAGENLLRNGAFEEWEGAPAGMPPAGKPSHWLGRLPVVRGPGLGAGSRYSAIVRDPAQGPGGNKGAWFVQSLRAPLRGGFRIGFTLSVLSSGADQFEQPFGLNLYQDDESGKKQKWVCFRLERSGGRSPLRPRLNRGAEWILASETHTFDGADYDPQSNTFQVFVSYRFSLTYDQSSDSYLIECGPPGREFVREFMRLEGRREFRHPTRGTGLTQVEFFAYDQGFAIDDVTLEPL